MAILSSPEGWEIEFVVGNLNSMSQANLTWFYKLKKEIKEENTEKKWILEDIWQHIVFIYEESLLYLI